jgi:hypothetical protein
MWPEINDNESESGIKAAISGIVKRRYPGVWRRKMVAAGVAASA